MQMGRRQGVFDEHWKVKEACRDHHIVPCVMDEVLQGVLPVSFT